jgi:hypothetical protein
MQVQQSTGRPAIKYAGINRKGRPIQAKFTSRLHRRMMNLQDYQGLKWNEMEE